MQCPNCQKAVPVAANVCGHCGHRLKQAAPPTPTGAPVTSAASPTQAVPGWLGASIGALAVLGVVAAIGWFVLFRPAPEQTAAPTSALAAPASTLPPATEPVFTGTSGQPQSIAFDIPGSVIETDDFSRPTDFWSTSGSGIQWEDGSLQVVGAPVFETFLAGGTTLEMGQGVLWLLEYSTADSNMNFLIEQGEWNAPDYRRLGINLQQAAVADIYEGTQSLWGEPLQGTAQLLAGRTYYVLLSLDAARVFSAVIGEADDPASFSSFSLALSSDWPTDQWHVAVQASTGRIRIDQYYLLSLE